MILRLLTVLQLFLLPSFLIGQTVLIPEFSKDFPRAKDFKVSANNSKLPVLEGEVAAMAYATVGGPVKISIEKSEPFSEVIIRPLNAGITPEIRDGKITFTLPKALNLSIEFDGNIKRPLFLFTCPPRNNVPDKSDPKVHYYEAGKIHTPGEIVLEDNEILYLEPGAIVRSVVKANNVQNIKILGGGILDQSSRRQNKVHSVQLTECQNILVQDVHIHDAYGWTLHPQGCDNVVIDNHKQTGWRPNSDGIDIEACRNLTVKNCFLMNADDCIAVKSKNAEIVKRRGHPTVDKIVIEKSVFWNTLPGNALEIGFELQGATVQNILFRDCDVIRVERGAVFSIHNAGTATVNDVVFENVRVEDAMDELIDLYIGLSVYSPDIPEQYARRNGWNIPDSLQDPDANDNHAQWLYLPENEREKYDNNRGRIENITFKNIRVLTSEIIPSLIKGWDDEEHSINNVLIENLCFGEKHIKSASEGKFSIKHAHNVDFQ